MTRISRYLVSGNRNLSCKTNISAQCSSLQRLSKLHSDDAEVYEDHHPDLRPAMIELQMHLKYEKQLRNLQLQEARLHRRYEKESAELRQLQKDRAAKEAEQPALKTQAVAATSNGFDFSNSCSLKTPSGTHSPSLTTKALESEIEA